VHELSICRSLLREVERVAAAHEAKDVTGITIAVGPLSGIEPSLLARAFDIARAGTIAENAALRIEEMPVMVWCRHCEVETEATINALACGPCGTWQVDLRSGNELLLKRVELTGVEDGAQSSAAA
jgi:hydrogenase nickel incorporation protein HypA/HybF